MSKKSNERPLTINDFIAKIAEEVGKGREFCPLLGSGISHPSGIMIGRGFTSYLAYTFCRCVLSEDKQEAFGLQKNNGQRDLRQEGWPAFPKPEQLAIARKKILELYKPLRKNSAIPGRHDYGLLSGPLVPECLADSQDDQLKEWKKEDDQVILPYWRNHHGDGVRRALTEERFRPRRAQPSQQEILEYGIRCLADWRATLNFLARLKVEKSNGGAGKVTLALSDLPELRLVDSFSAHLGLGKKPNLNHMMIAHLARMLRMQVLLTTNFDTLLEDAFVSARQPLQVIPVSLKGDLPDPATVRVRRTLLKLHGTQHETRADWSLDETPSSRDVGAFTEYLRAGGATVRTDDRPDAEAPSLHLLVLGFSGLDVRVMDYLRAALIQHPNLHIFWVANSGKTEPDKLAEKLGLTIEEARQRLHLTVTAHTDLLLYELYQRLGKYLPPSGFSYQFSLNVPAWIEQAEAEDVTRLLYQAMELREPGSVLGLKEGTGAEIDESLVLRFDSGVKASESVGRLYAYAVQQKKNCMWLELEDFCSAMAVGTVILHNIAYRLGLFNREHVDLTLREQELEHGKLASLLSHLRYLTDRYLDTSASEWVIFVYGRCVPGSCAGWTRAEGYEWDEAEWKRLQRLLGAFSRVGYRIILMPQTGNRRRYLDKQNDILQTALKYDIRQAARKYPKCRPPILYTENPLEKWEANIGATEIKTTGIATLASVTEWLCKGWKDGGEQPKTDKEAQSRLERALARLKENPDGDKIRFLYALTLFRQSRHPASLVSEGVFSCPHRFNVKGVDNDAYRFEKTRKWIEELSGHKTLRVFFRKDGGYLWMYGDIRQHLCFILEVAEIDENGVRHTQKTRRAKTHYWIAEWYFFAFLSSGHPDPLVESLYHRMQAIHHLPSETRSKENDDRDAGNASYRLDLLHACLCKLSKTLFIARHKIAAWSQLLHTCGIFKQNEIKAVLGWPNSSAAGGDKFKVWLRNKVLMEVKPKDAAGILKLCREIIDQVTHLESMVYRLGDNPAEWSPPLAFGVGGQGVSLSKIPQSNPVAQTLASGHDIYVNIYRKNFMLAGNPPGKKKRNPIFQGDLTGEIDSTHVKATRKEIVANMRDEPGRLLALAHVLRSHAYFIYKYANLRTRVVRLAHARGDFPRRLYQRCTAYCRIALEVLNHLPAAFAHEDNVLRYELHILYAVSLANLDRFQEAQRRLTEADYLTHVMESEIIAEKRGVLHLRRAEIDLLQARYYRRLAEEKELRTNTWYSTDELLLLAKNKTGEGISAESLKKDSLKKKLAALRTAKIKDAVTELDAAEAGLAGRSRSTLWSHKLCVLRLLSIATENSERDCTTACRQRIDPLELMREWFEQGLFLTTHDAYRRIQIYDVYTQALDTHFDRKRIAKEKRNEIKIEGDVKKEIGIYLFRTTPGLETKLKKSTKAWKEVLQAMLGDGNQEAWKVIWQNAQPPEAEPEFCKYAEGLAKKVARYFLDSA